MFFCWLTRHQQDVNWSPAHPMPSFTQESTLARESPTLSLLSIKTLPLTKVLNVCISSLERNPLVFWPLMTQPWSRWAHHWLNPSFKPSFRPIGPAIWVNDNEACAVIAIKYPFLVEVANQEWVICNMIHALQGTCLISLTWCDSSTLPLSLLHSTWDQYLKTICPLQNFPWLSHL